MKDKKVLIIALALIGVLVMVLMVSSLLGNKSSNLATTIYDKPKPGEKTHKVEGTLYYKNSLYHKEAVKIIKQPVEVKISCNYPKNAGANQTDQYVTSVKAINGKFTFATVPNNLDCWVKPQFFSPKPPISMTNPRVNNPFPANIYLAPTTTNVDVDKIVKIGMDVRGAKQPVTPVNISGSITTSEGTAVSGITVACIETETSLGTFFTKTDTAGAFSLNVEKGTTCELTPSGTDLTGDVDYTFIVKGSDPALLTDKITLTNIQTPVSNQNFTAMAASLSQYTISGTVKDSSGVGVAGVGLDCGTTTGIATTGTDGSFSFSRAEDAGDCFLKPQALAGYTFEPATGINVKQNQNASNLIFTAKKTVALTLTGKIQRRIPGAKNLFDASNVTVTCGTALAKSDSKGMYSLPIAGGTSCDLTVTGVKTIIDPVGGKYPITPATTETVNNFVITQ